MEHSAPREHPPFHTPLPGQDAPPAPTTAAAPASRGARQMIAAFTGAILFLGVASLIKPEPRSASAHPGGSRLDSRTTSLPPNHLRSGAGAAHTPFPNEDDTDTIAQRLGKTPHRLGWALLGQLEGREHRVLIYASPDGPRYSVFTLGGEPLLADLIADDLYRAFPDLDLSVLHDLPGEGRGKALMLVDPRD